MNRMARLRAHYGMAIGMMALLVSLGMLLIDLRAARCRSDRSESGQYEAEWVFAAAQEEIITNGVGDVVQPTDVEYHWRHGAKPRSLSSLYPYENLKMNIESRVASFLAKEVQKRKLLERYLSQDCGFDAAQVSNAFASVRYKMSGKYIPVVRVLARSENSDVAIGVLSLLASEFTESWKEEQDRIVDKALSEHWLEMERMKKSGESIETKLKEYEELKKCHVEFLSLKMLTLVPPRVKARVK